MGESVLDNVKKDIRSVLIASKEGLPVVQFLKTYTGIIGARFPFREFGFTTAIEFLQSIPDVVRIQTDVHGQTRLHAEANEATVHIKKLVQKQRSNTKQKLNEKVRLSYAPTPLLCNPRSQPFVPARVQSEIMTILREHAGGITCSCLFSEYLKKFGKPLSLGWLGHSVEEQLRRLVLGAPEFELMVKNGIMKIRYVGGNKNVPLVSNGMDKKKLCSSGHANKDLKTSSSNGYGNNVSSKKQISSSVNGLTESSDKKENMVPKSLAIPLLVRQNIEKVLKTFPGGILAAHFPILFEKSTGKSLNIQQLGFVSLLELADSLPEICVKRKTVSHSNPNDYKLYHIDYSENILSGVKAAVKLINSQKKSDVEKRVPSSFHYSQPILPESSKHENIPVYVSSCISPSVFWFQLHTPETVLNLKTLEEHIANLYNVHGEKLKMADVDILIGSPCVVFSTDANQWYRALIKSMPTINEVIVSLVDYGGMERIPRSSIYHLSCDLSHLPVQAFKAKLSSLIPANQATSWSTAVRKTFIKMCKYSVLMAEIHTVRENVVHVFLCDSRGDDDIHINDMLINQGLAERSINVESKDNYSPHCFSSEASSSNSPDAAVVSGPNFNGFQHSLEKNVTKDSQSSAQNNCKISQQFKTILNLDHEVEGNSSKDVAVPVQNGVKRNVFLNSNQTHCSSEGSMKEPEPPSQNGLQFFKYPRKRLIINEAEVKEMAKMKNIRKVQLGDGYAIHILRVKKEAYVSGEDLSNLFWDGRGAGILSNLLAFKGISLPTILISNEEFKDFFEECARCCVDEFTKTELPETITLYTLKDALTVLNCLGQPSVLVRKTLLKEIEEFNPYSAVWRANEDVEDFNSYETNKDSNELNRLCLYDLKLYQNCLGYKKSNLEKKLEESGDKKYLKEIESIQSTLKSVMLRIYEVEEICSTYS